MFGCGAEENNPSDNVPVNMNISFQSFEGGVLYTSKLNDIGGVDLKDNYKGSSLYIYGGRNLYIPNFFSTEPGGYNPEVNPGSSRTTHITILGNVRAVYLTNPRWTGQSRVVNPIRIERFPQSGGDSPRDVNLFFNPTDDRPDDGTSWYSSAPNFVFTRSGSTTSCTGIIMDQGLNTEVKNGSTYYTPWFYKPDSLYTPTTPYKALLATDANDEVFPLTVTDTVYIPIPTYMSASDVYASPVGVSITSYDANVAAYTVPGETKKILACTIYATSIVTSPETIDVYLHNNGTSIPLFTIPSGATFPYSYTLPTNQVISSGAWTIRLSPIGYGGAFKSVSLLVKNY